MSASNESSIVFNLEEIMNLERERVQAEAAAARAAEQRERDARQHAALAARELEQSVAEQAEARQRAEHQSAQRAEDEHQARLLQLRIDAESAERLERERLGLEHQRTLSRMQTEVGRGQMVRGLSAVVGLLAAGLIAAHVVLVQPALSEARERVAEAERRMATGAHENSELRRRILQIQATMPSAADPAPVAPETSPSAVAAPTRKPTRGKPPRPRPARRHDRELDGLDATDDDPLTGLVEYQP